LLKSLLKHIFLLLLCCPLAFANSIAPEVLEGAGYGPGVDIWACGGMDLLLCFDSGV
jgi:hypothetical protein